MVILVSKKILSNSLDNGCQIYVNGDSRDFCVTGKFYLSEL